jgi:hypothetical protein
MFHPQCVQFLFCIARCSCSLRACLLQLILAIVQIALHTGKLQLRLAHGILPLPASLRRICYQPFAERRWVRTISYFTVGDKGADCAANFFSQHQKPASLRVGGDVYAAQRGANLYLSRCGGITLRGEKV